MSTDVSTDAKIVVVGSISSFVLAAFSVRLYAIFVGATLAFLTGLFIVNVAQGKDFGAKDIMFGSIFAIMPIAALALFFKLIIRISSKDAP